MRCFPRDCATERNPPKSFELKDFSNLSIDCIVLKGSSWHRRNHNVRFLTPDSFHRIAFVKKGNILAEVWKGVTSKDLIPPIQRYPGHKDKFERLRRKIQFVTWTTFTDFPDPIKSMKACSSVSFFFLFFLQKSFRLTDIRDLKKNIPTKLRSLN